MNLWRRILTLSFALAVTVMSVVCLGQVPPTQKTIYDETADAHVELKDALKKARAEHKRVIVVFGANWCYDCHVLDAAFHRPDLAEIIAANYEVVHIDIGRAKRTRT